MTGLKSRIYSGIDLGQRDGTSDLFLVFFFGYRGPVGGACCASADSGGRSRVAYFTRARSLPHQKLQTLLAHRNSMLFLNTNFQQGFFWEPEKKRF